MRMKLINKINLDKDKIYKNSNKKNKMMKLKNKFNFINYFKYNK